MHPPDRVAAPQLEVLVDSPLWAGADAALDLMCWRFRPSRPPRRWRISATS
jgi:hypothetical protein